jgi:hypothetical protein
MNYGKNQYNRFMLYLRTKSFDNELQLLVNVRVKEVHLFCVFLTTTIIRWNSNKVNLYLGILGWYKTQIYFTVSTVK